MFNDPVDRIEWRQATSLKANAWNPNYVMDAELNLLERSILRQGWIQAVLITEAGMIIDGFHRWMLSIEIAALQKKYKGQVPCAILDVTEAEAKTITVRINRAKGAHAAVKMSDLVKSLIDQDGMSPSELAKNIGATKDEIDLLYQDSIFKAKNIEKYRYSQAWVPMEVAGRNRVKP